MYVVYIIHSATAQRYYAGLTTSLTERLEQHRKGQNRSTSHARDWKIVWQTYIGDSSSARSFEKRIKARGIRRFIDDNQKFQPPLAAG